MRSLHLLVSLLTVSLWMMAFSCNPATKIVIDSPTPLQQVTDCSVQVNFHFVGAFSTPPTVTLNFSPLAVPVVEGPPGSFTATIGPEDGLQDSNILLVSANRASDGQTLTQGASFDHNPPASAYPITNPADLLSGPLAHGRVGDFMLESCVARFVVQDGGQRDLYSVGQYGGNLIDAERIGSPGVESFLEIQPMVNLETVINATSVIVWNDGTDGNPAVVRACGPDDLLDFANPSTSIGDVGLAVPPNINDNDQTIDGCTDYTLAARDSHVAMTTTLSNFGAAPLDALLGDWLNAAGELDVFHVPGAGVGPPATSNALGALGFFGKGDGAGVDYSFVSLPTPTPAATSFVTISGVTIVFAENNIVLALFGIQTGVTIPALASHTWTRYFGVGDGTGGNTIDLDIQVRGLAKARVEGCVTVGGVPAPDSRVTVATFAGPVGAGEVATHFRTDSAGCYSGDVPTPTSPTGYSVIAGRHGTLFEGGAASPVLHPISLNPGDTATVDIDLPATGSLKVTATDENSTLLPARVTVVGFDPSPQTFFAGPALPGFGGADLSLLFDPDDTLPFGVVAAEQTGADGVVVFDLEPGDYRIVVSRGMEYSYSDQAVTITGGAQTTVAAQIAQVLDTDGFVSSEFHVHGVNSADSRVSHGKRVNGYAAEGVDNVVMTDHHVHTDLGPTIASEGLGAWLSSTIGEEVTTFDSGHFNAYPLTQDASRVTLGSTDWAGAALPGMDFPSAGAFNLTPAEVLALGTTGATSTADTTMQINHIDSHFETLQLDTSLVPPADGLDAAERLERRLDEPLSTNLFQLFPALELWNGDGRNDQNQFLNERIGVWFNLLNQGLNTTFIADTDSHRFTNLNYSGARTWTAAAPGSDSAGTVDSGEVAQMVTAGKATGGQGIFVTTKLRATDHSGDFASLDRFGSTFMTDAAGNVELDIRVQAPTWSEFDTIEIYANAATTVVDPAAPYLYSAVPTMTLNEGDCSSATTGDGAFDVAVVNVAAVPGADRLEANVTVPFSGLTVDTWFVVVVKGTDGVCPALFPVFAKGLNSTANLTPADLMDGNVGESGVLALGATNALYFEAP
ncbi:MAG: hypothetical protein JRH01_15845 [Deltaproteobacteria bacterium]|nr:hypothetical protein [Deltaproteobacteria bacterium]